MRFVLASASPRRLDLLRQIGVTPDAVVATDVDESPRADEAPRALALRLALAKATAAAQADAVVLAADTVVAAGRRLLGKAESEDEARRWLTLLSGRAHQVITGVAVRTPHGVMRHRVVLTRVRFARLTSADITAYVESGEWRGKAGAYGIQGRAERFVASLNGSYSNVVGLPLQETAFLLRAAGVVVP
jgi:septum formation protein